MPWSDTPYLGNCRAGQVPGLIEFVGRHVVTLVQVNLRLRATVFDATAHDYRAIVTADCVFDRIEISHDIALFDLDRQFADVIMSADVLRQFSMTASDGR